MTNLAAGLPFITRVHPDREAVRLDETVLTYSELDDLTGRVAGWLRARGIAPGDRVGIMLPNVPAFPVLYYGVLRAGGTVVPMNPLLKAREIQHYLEDSGARLTFVWEEFAQEATLAARAVAASTQVAEEMGVEVVAITPESVAAIGGWPRSAEVEERAPSDTAVILYTSGTTGTPKGAELTHVSLRRNAEISRDIFDITVGEVVMGCLPLFHAFGQTCGMNAALGAGATLTLIQRFEATKALHVIERDEVTVFQGVPTMYMALLAAGRGGADISSLRVCVSGGAALPGEVLTTFAEIFGATILEGYGLSETSPVASFNHVGNTRAGSIGHPVEGVEMKIVDDAGNEVTDGGPGEIAIRGHNVMKGYWNRPAATHEAIRDGWFFSGDVGRRDEDGFFYVVDRKKEMIIRGGFNIYPRELEEVLYEHPEVTEAAVVGVPHPTHGEEVAAAVVLRPGATVTGDEIRDYMKERVAAYKYPRLVWILPEFPKGPTGKILKRAITSPETVS